MGKTEDIPYFGYLSNAALSDVGRKRKNNEDNYGAFADYGLFCVADGMGGASDGEVASRIVVEHLSATIKNWKKFKRPIPLEDRLALVDKTLDAASAWINQYADSHEARGCGTTFVGVVLDPADATKAVAMHAGDSRLYLIHKKKIAQITNDHSVANMTGIKNEADLDPVFRNMILRAVGIKPTVELERTHFKVSAGDSILICSDGLTKMLSDKQILKIILETQNCHKGVRSLIDEANRLGGKDNVTAILVNISYIPPVREVHPRLSEEEFLSCLTNGETETSATTESAFTMPTTATSSTYDDFSDSTQRDDDTWLDNDSDDDIPEQPSIEETVDGKVQMTQTQERVESKDNCCYQSQEEGLTVDYNAKKRIWNISAGKKKFVIFSIVSILILAVGGIAINNIKRNKDMAIARQTFNSNVKAIIDELDSLKSEIEISEEVKDYSNEISSACHSLEKEILKARLNSISEDDLQEIIASFCVATNCLAKAVKERQNQIEAKILAERRAIEKEKQAKATAAFNSKLASANETLKKHQSNLESSDNPDGVSNVLQELKAEVEKSARIATDAGVSTEESMAAFNRLYAEIENEIVKRKKFLAEEKEKLSKATAAFNSKLASANETLKKYQSNLESSDNPDGVSNVLQELKAEVEKSARIATAAGVSTEESMAAFNRLYAEIENEIVKRKKFLAEKAEMMASIKYKFINDSWGDEQHIVWSNSTIQIRDVPHIVSRSLLSGTKKNSNSLAFWGTKENERQPKFLQVISLPLSQINGHIACIKLSHTNCLDITHLDEYINDFKKNTNNTNFYPNCTRKCNEKWKDMKEISNAMLLSHEKLKKVVLDYIWLVEFLMEKNQEFDFDKDDFEEWKKSVNEGNY